MSSLPRLLDDRAPLAELASALDAMTHGQRIESLAALTRAQQRQLYEAAATAPALTLADFVGSTPRTVVPHRGYNTLPLTASGRRFTKWMCRQPGGAVAGWNDSPWAWLIGPGFFTLRDTTGPESEHGAIVVDYYRTPSRDGMPDHWPWIRPNWLGLQAFVYGWCHDYMRKVSDHVTIGAAFKWGRPVGSWFVLCRDDEA
jgi:hypothetical protein